MSSPNSAARDFFANLKLTSSKKVPDPDRPGHFIRKETSELYRVDLLIYVNDLMQELGVKAVNNKSKKSKAQGGLIQVSVRKL